MLCYHHQHRGRKFTSSDAYKLCESVARTTVHSTYACMYYVMCLCNYQRSVKQQDLGVATLLHAADQIACRLLLYAKKLFYRDR